MSQRKNKWKKENDLFSPREKKDFRQTQYNKKYRREDKRSGKTNMKIAKAPYNFVPLNKKVVKVDEIPGKDRCTFDRYYEDRKTGYIKLEITTKTPLYIRDTLNENELKEKANIEKNGKIKYINPDFFSPAGKFRIPGSSLRGVIRTMVEIMSFGKFITFDDDRLYFRTFGDRLGKSYRNIMIDEKNYAFQKVKTGILKKEGKNYVIYPSKIIQGTQIYRVDYDIESRIIKGGEELKVKEFDFKEVYFQPVSPVVHGEHGFPLKYALIKSIKTEKDDQHQQKGFLVSSGDFSDKKHMHWIINEEDPNADKLKLIDDLVKSYKDDINRNVGEKADLIKYLDKNSKSFVPCFYVEANGKLKSFGHTGMFRLAFNNSIGDYVLESLKNEKIIDIAEAIFGDKDNFSGRVFFEDAFLDQNQSDFLMEVNIPQILSNSKPTSFQLYLEQDKEKLKSEGRNIGGPKNYNDADTQIRGYKLYWHKSGKNWKETCLEFKKKEFTRFLIEKSLNREDFKDSIITDRDKENINLYKLENINNQLFEKVKNAVGIYETQHTRIKAVKEEIVFIGNIRFENLSDIELGALLFALDLPEECCHKVGMGKSLGLGSVVIMPRLFLSDRKKRYKDLFSEWDEIKESIEEDKTITNFKEKFEKYILLNIGDDGKGISGLWDLERMKELKHMLDFSNKPEDIDTSYMNLKDFKERNVLPEPSEIKRRNK